MAECAILSDRMPAVAAGRDVWSSDDLTHLAQCVECAAEWELVATASRMGSHSAHAPDSAALSRSVVDRLAVARRVDVGRRRRTWLAAALAAAAAVVLLLSGRPPSSPAPALAHRAAASVESAALVPELDSLDAGELRDVLDAFDAPLSERVIIGTPTLGDLSDQELERVLRAGGV